MLVSDGKMAKSIIVFYSLIFHKLNFPAYFFGYEGIPIRVAFGYMEAKLGTPQTTTIVDYMGAAGDPARSLQLAGFELL